MLISYQRLAERSESMINIFEQIKSRVTARQAAEYYGLKVERNGMACCPFHDDKHPSMKIDQNYYCFGCGAKGDATNYVAEMFGLSQLEAAKKMIQDMQLPIEIKKACKRGMPQSIKNRKELEDAQIDEIKKQFQKWCADREQLFFDSLNMIQAVKEEQKNIPDGFFNCLYALVGMFNDILSPKMDNSITEKQKLFIILIISITISFNLVDPKFWILSFFKTSL